MQVRLKTSVRPWVGAARDLCDGSDPGPPWWLPLHGDYRSLTGFRRTSLGQWCTNRLAAMLEQIGAAPKGSTAVAKILGKAANGLVGLGRIGAFTPALFFHARKP
jgi:sterol 24-C-methyltransferase